MKNIKTLLPLISLLLLLTIEPHGADKKTANSPGPEGWNGFGTHVTTMCNIHPFIYSFQTGLEDLFNETFHGKIKGINIQGTLSRTAPISWITTDFAIHSILPIGFKQSRDTNSIVGLNRIKPIVDRKSAISAEKNLSRIEDILDSLRDSSKIDSIKEMNASLSMAVEYIREILEPFSKPEIKKDIDQYDYELEDTCFSFEAFGSDNPVIQSSEALLQMGADKEEIMDKNMNLLRILVDAARKKEPIKKNSRNHP